jgi:hypothetical protein
MDFLAVFNPTEEEVTTTINGSFFTWKPGQIKQMRAGQADFVDTNRKELGLMKLEDPRFIPAEQEKYIPGFEKTDEGKKILEPLREKGINNLIDHLMEIIRNNQVSLRQDLANKYPTGDSAKLAAAYASPAELNAMRLVAKYKKKNNSNSAKQVEEIEKLMQEIGPFTA